MTVAGAPFGVPPYAVPPYAGAPPSGGGPPTISVEAEAIVVATSSASAFVTLPPPLPQPGPSGLHDYEVIVTDKYGIAKGQIVTAVPTQIDWVLDDLGQALIDFWILDPTSLMLPLEDLPGASEIQIWRDQVLIWWGWPTSCTFDAKQVHLTCAGLLFPFSKRNFGPVTTNYLVNPSFELPGGLGVIPGWTAVGVTSGTVGTTPDTPPILGSQQAELIQASAGVDTYLRQYIPFSTGAIGDLFDVSAWCYISPNATFAPAFGQNGIFIQWIVSSVVVAGPAIQQITENTGQGQWVRLDVQLELPPNQTGVLEVRLYAPQGVIYWDACRATIPESVASALQGSDVQFIMENIVNYCNDPTRGKSDLAIPFSGPATGHSLIRAYQLSDNAGVLDALNEFPTIGICDYEVTWDATGHFRQFQIFPPAKGSIKYNFPLTLDLGAITDLEGGIDGTKAVTASIILGQGSSGSSRDIGYAAFPSALGGRVAQDGMFVQGSSTIESATINFTSEDVGQGVYCQEAGVLPIGTTIASIIDSSHATITSNQGGGAILTAGPVGIGIGGVILDSVASALSDLPIGTLQGTAETTIETGAQTQFLPTARQRADGPAGLFGLVEVGDVLPVSMDYGWLDIDPVLMRIQTISLYPPTEEMECQMNPIPVGSNEYG